MKKSKFFIMLFLCSIILFSGASTFQASKTEDNVTFEEDIEKMRERYQELDIDEEIGEQLIEKVLNGEMLDSQKDNISEEDKTIIVNENGLELIEFPDGSRAMMSFQIIQPITPYGSSTGTVDIESCNGTCDALVRYNDLIWDIKYDAELNLYNQGNPGIVKVTNKRSDAVLYEIESIEFGVVRYNSTSSNPAKARWQFKAKHKTGLYELTRDLSLYVDKNSSAYARLEWD